MDVAIFCAVIILVVLVLLVRGQPKINISRDYYNRATMYTAAINSGFSSAQNRNKLTFNERAILEKLEKEFPEIVGGSVNLPILGQTPSIRLDVSGPSLALVNHGVSYVVDERGTVIGPRSEWPDLSRLPRVVDSSGLQAETGKQILAANEVAFIKTVLAQYDRANIPIEAISLPGTPQELDVKPRDRKYTIKFNTASDGLVQIGRSLAARKQFDKQAKQPSQYLDVRVDGKIYYR